MNNAFIAERQLEAIAYDVLRRHQSTHGVISKPPVPVEEIIEDTLQLGILWEPVTEPPDVHVLAGLDSGSRRVVFNEERRRLFDETPGLYQTVLGHEGGHWSVHVDKAALQQTPFPGFEQQFDCMYRTDRSAEPRETQAHKFMSYLLLPDDILFPIIRHVDLLKWHNLYELRDLFEVTISVLTIRLQRLNLLYITEDRKLYPSRQEFLGQTRLTP